MRARTLNFRRNNNPRKSLGIGIFRKKYNITKEDWEAMPTGNFLVAAGSSFDQIKEEYLSVFWNGINFGIYGNGEWGSDEQYVIDWVKTYPLKMKYATSSSSFLSTKRPGKVNISWAKYLGPLDES